MSRSDLVTGELVKILRGQWTGSVGIVTKPISERMIGHVLVCQGGSIIGIDASCDDVELAGESSEGFAQLGYQMIKLGSHVIEQKLIVYKS